MLTYEEVSEYIPTPDTKRPVILVSCDELKPLKLCERLESSYPDKFTVAKRSENCNS